MADQIVAIVLFLDAENPVHRVDCRNECVEYFESRVCKKSESKLKLPVIIDLVVHPRQKWQWQW